MSPSVKSDSVKPPSSEGLTLSKLNNILQEIYQPALEKELNTPLPWVWKSYSGKEDDPAVPSMSINSKLQTLGCPACGGKSCFYAVLDKDLYGCNKCNAEFSEQWLAHWNGDAYTRLVGKTVGVSHPSKYNPFEEDLTEQEDRFGQKQKMVQLYEKVVAFREAVINPDRVLEDDQIETLMREMFDVSYSIYVPQVDNTLFESDTYDESGMPDLAPDSYSSATEYALALMNAVAEKVLTHEQAEDLFKAFGGPDPFPDDPGEPFAFPA